MQRLHFAGPLLLLALSFALFGCDDTTTPTDGGGTRDTGVGTDAGTPTDAGQPTDGGTMDSGAPDAGGPDAGPTGTRVLVGHLGGSSFQLHQFSAVGLSPTSGSPFTAPGAYNDIAVNPARNQIALVLPGDDAVALLDASTLTSIASIPVGTTPLTATFDSAGDRLFIYAADGASDRQLYVFDVSTGTPAAVSGSPFAVTIVATSLAHDATTGRLYGISSTTQWALEIGSGGVTLVGGSPVSGGAVGMVIDTARRRFYATRQFPSRLVVRDLDTFEEVAGSPLALPGDYPTSLALDPDSGNLFLLDGAPAESSQPTTLHYITTSPLAVQDTCGAAAGCTLPETETGIAFDRLSDRLFISVTRGEAAGELAVWDVSTPAMPVELNGDSRPSVGSVPAWVITH